MSEVGASDFPAGRWRARWIWFETPAFEREGTFLAGRARARPAFALFRRSVELAAVPARVPARATADSRYVLYANGREVSRGPVRSNPRRLRYDAFDLAPALRPGRNALAAVVRFFGTANPWWMPVPPALQLGAGCFLFEARVGEGWLASDSAWKAVRAEGLGEIAGRGVGGLPLESCDARALAPGFEEPGFDDAAWGAAVELSAASLGFSGRHEPPSHPYGPLLPRPIAALGCAAREPAAVRQASAPAAPPGADPVECALADLGRAGSLRAAALPLALPAAPGARVVCVDFGEVVAGTVALELDAPAGTQVDAAAAEFADASGALRPEGERGGFRYVARGSEDRFETFSPLGLRHLALSIRGDGPVTLRRVAVHERLRPRPPGPFFECSDPLLNRIFEVGLRTVDLCAQDAYLDCPTREQRGWTGDFVVHQMVDLAANPDWRLAAWNVELAASPRPDGMLPMAAGGDVEHGDTAFIPDWALHWVRALANLWRWTGDREALARLLPVAENVLRWFEPFRAEDGLAADVTSWVLLDWSSVPADGKSSVLNALLARALRDFAALAGAAGDAGRAAWARRRHAEIARAFELFFDEARGLYVDAAVGSVRQPAASQHAQAAAIAAGLVPPARIARVADAMMDEARLVHAAWSVPGGDARRPRPGEGGIGGTYLLLGPPEPWWDVERQMVRAQPFFRYVVHDALAEAGRADRIAAACRDWSALLERCPTSWSETWYGGTVSHGWASTPTRDLLVYVLGAAPAEPGFTRARVAPRLGDLAFARGAVATPHGLLRVEVDGRRVHVESPVPFELDLGAGAPTHHPAGEATVERPAESSAGTVLRS